MDLSPHHRIITSLHPGSARKRETSVIMHTSLEPLVIKCEPIGETISCGDSCSVDPLSMVKCELADIHEDLCSVDPLSTKCGPATVREKDSLPEADADTKRLLEIELTLQQPFIYSMPLPLIVKTERDARRSIRSSQSKDVRTKNKSCSSPSEQALFEDEQPFFCDICNKHFKRKPLLRQHINNTHATERKFPCETCNKTFRKNCHLKYHMRTHTDERKFICEICRKAFTQSSSKKMHMLTHTGERKFSCEMCVKTFKQRGHLKAHMLTHTGERHYSCEMCNKVFTQSGNLKKHLFTHTGERNYSCEKCKKTFTQSSHLNRHMLTHTGISESERDW